jgi:hypothetical protein
MAKIPSIQGIISIEKTNFAELSKIKLFVENFFF